MSKKAYILYDYQIFDSQEIGGISRYFCEIIRRIKIRKDISVKYSSNYYLRHWNLGRHRIPLPKWILKRYQNKCEKKNISFTIKKLTHKSSYLFHPTYYDPYFLEFIGNNPFVITVHDMIHEIFPHIFTDSRIVAQQKKELILRANHIIAISENTKNDIITILNVNPNKIDVIHHGTSMKAFNGSYSLDLPHKYLLYVGSRTPYKNFIPFLNVFSILSQEISDLYLVCTGLPFNENELNTISTLNLSNKVTQISASDKELSELYSRAELFVFPSLYEGFGIPILEAYACGCPIALSNTSCFPEIAGKAGAYFNPYSEQSMLETLRDIIGNKTKQKQLITAGKERLKCYSWEEAAKRTEAVYNKVLSKLQEKS